MGDACTDIYLIKLYYFLCITDGCRLGTLLRNLIAERYVQEYQRWVHWYLFFIFYSQLIYLFLLTLIIFLFLNDSIVNQNNFRLIHRRMKYYRRWSNGWLKSILKNVNILDPSLGNYEYILNTSSHQLWNYIPICISSAECI